MIKLFQTFSVLFLLLLSSFASAQQDPQYSQYMFNQLAINPAYAGSKEQVNVVGLFRKQWVSMPGAPQTNALSLHSPIRKAHMGIGTHLMYETIGPKKWTAAYLDLAYNFRLGRGRMSLGLGAGVVNYIFDYNKLDYKDPGELLSSTSDFGNNRTALDLNAGFYYYSQTFYMGGSITHLNRPSLYNTGKVDTSLVGTNTVLNYNLNTHTFFYFGKGFLINEDLIISPTFMIKYEDPWRISYDLNLNFQIKKKIWAGMGYRAGYGIILLAQFAVSEKFKVGYTFDYGFGRLGRAGKSSHEIMIGYDINLHKAKIVSPRYL